MVGWHDNEYIHSPSAMLMISGHRRSCQLRCIYFCSCDSSNTAGCIERFDRVRIMSPFRTEIRAVLAAIFLKEELGPLGRIGCAICLIGSVIIVLHAPPDINVETVDEILNYAIQPCLFPYIMASHFRVLELLSTGYNIRFSNDLSRRAGIWQEKPTRLYLHLLNRWIRLRHVNQRIWHCSKTNLCRVKSVHAPFNIRIRHRRRCLHSSSNELL